MAKSRKSSSAGQRPAQTAAAAAASRSGLTIKLQIAAGVFVPMLALGLWLNSKGFFG